MLFGCRCSFGFSHGRLLENGLKNCPDVRRGTARRGHPACCGPGRVAPGNRALPAHQPRSKRSRYNTKDQATTKTRTNNTNATEQPKDTANARSWEFEPNTRSTRVPV